MEDDRALFESGRAAFAQKEYEKASEIFSRLVAERAPAYEARLWLGRTYFAQKKFAEAIPHLEAFLNSDTERDPVKKAVIVELLADAYAAQENVATAVRWYRAAYAAYGAGDPGAARIEEKIESLVLETSKMEPLDELIGRFGEETPADLAWYRRMELKLLAGDVGGAKGDGEEFLKFFPTHAFADLVRLRIRVADSALKADPGKVGVLLPLSGKYAIFGQRALRGLELAKEALVKGKEPVEFLVRDTKGDPKEAERLVDELTFTDGVVAILGPLLSTEAQAAAARAEALAMPILVLSQKEGLPEIGPHVFRYFLTPQDQVRSVVEFAMGDRGLRNFGILYPDNALGRDFMSRFWEEVESRGGWIVAAESYPATLNDFEEPLARMTGVYHADARQYEEHLRSVAAGEEWDPHAVDRIAYSYWRRFHPAPGPGERAPKWPPEQKRLPPLVDFDAVFIPDTFEKAALIAPQFLYRDVGGTELLGIAAWNNPKLITLGGKSVEGSLFVDGFSAESDRSLISDFVERYAARHKGEKPSLLDAAGYDGALLFRTLLAGRGEGLQRAVFRKRLGEVDHFPLLLGNVSFDESGEARIPLMLLTVAQGRINEVGLEDGEAMAAERPAPPRSP